MSNVLTHPSYLELDRHCTGLPCDGTTVVHVASCDRCRVYVASYVPLENTPEWLVTSPPLKAAWKAAWKAPNTRRKTSARWYGIGGLAVAAAVCLALFAPRSQEPRYDGVKGGPAVGVYAQRDGVVTLWDGSALSTGDRIRLEVMPEEFDHVSVFSLQGSEQKPVRLYVGRLTPHARAMLPVAWELDAAPEPEQLVVILAGGEISPQIARTMLDKHVQKDVAVIRLSLPKQSRKQ